MKIKISIQILFVIFALAVGKENALVTNQLNFGVVARLSGNFEHGNMQNSFALEPGLQYTPFKRMFINPRVTFASNLNMRKQVLNIAPSLQVGIKKANSEIIKPYICAGAGYGFAARILFAVKNRNPNKYNSYLKLAATMGLAIEALDKANLIAEIGIFNEEQDFGYYGSFWGGTKLSLGIGLDIRMR